MKKVIFITFSFLMMAGVSVSAQDVIKVPKDSATTTVITSPKVEPAKTEITVPKDSTATAKVKLVNTEMKSADLPQPVKDLGANFKSQGWDTEEKAFVAKGVNGDVVFYVVTFKNTKTGESKSINIDAKGNIVKE